MTKMSKTFGVVCCIMVLSVFATVVRTEGVWANDVRHGPCVTGNGSKVLKLTVDTQDRVIDL